MEENKITLHADAAAKAKADKMREESKPEDGEESDSFAKPQ
jgi:hypothetical protein